jgi:glutaconate CoA-transferase, subunit A
MQPASPGAGAVPLRQPKVVSLAEAIERFVPAVCPSLVVGGMHLHNMPMALVRELVRQRETHHIETLIAGPAAGMGADLLIGAGLVDRAIVSYIGFEHFGLAPAFRRAAMAGHLRIHDIDAFALLEAVRAGGAGIPFAVLPPGLDRTGLPAAPDSLYRAVDDPFHGSRAWAVPALRPTVALISCQEADTYGNGIFRGATLADRTLALAADTVILQVEKIVEREVVLKAPQAVGIPGFRVAAVVAVGFGCHPTSAHRYYNYDDIHLQTYQQQAATEAGFWDYVKRYCDEPTTQDDYMDRVQEEEWRR